MPGFGQPYPEADDPSAVSHEFGAPAGDYGAGQFGGGAFQGGSEYQPGGGFAAQPGGAFGGSDYGSPDSGGFGGGEYGGGETGQQFGPGPEHGFGQPDVGQPFEGGAEPDYGQATQTFGASASGFGTPGYEQDATAGIPSAPPDVPGAGTAAQPTLTGVGPARSSSAARRSRVSAATARVPRPAVRTPARVSHGRQAHVTVARVEPMSVMKFSFVVSVVAFIVLFVAVAVLYGALAGLGVFDSLEKTIESLTSGQGSSGVNAAQWFSASRILGYAALFGALNIILITALSTVGAVLYNAAARLIGGVEVTLGEAE